MEPQNRAGRRQASISEQHDAVVIQTTDGRHVLGRRHHALGLGRPSIGTVGFYRARGWNETPRRHDKSGVPIVQFDREVRSA